MRSGQYINQLCGEVRYKAFIPNMLPFDIRIDSDLQYLLSKADMALGRLDGVAVNLPDVDFFILMYMRKEATLSSQVEGTEATFSDLLKAEAKIEDLEIHKDVDEIINYIRAMNYGLNRLKTLPMSLRLIKEIHEILLKGVRGETKRPGEFRTSQNWVGGTTIQTARFVPPTAQEVLQLMGNLEKFLHDKNPLPILVKIGFIHSQFESIHPFLDGNGRMGRLLITFYLCEQGVLHKPLLFLSEFFKKHRQLYYDKLNIVHKKDEIEIWLKFFLEGVAVTSEKAVATARKIIQLRNSDIEKITRLGRSAENGIKLINSLYKMPLIRIKDVERITELKNPNAIALVSKFNRLGILKEMSKRKRNRVFCYHNYIELFEK